jgi:putative redox protein
MNVTIKQIEGITFIGKGETNHWVTMDGPKQFNGSEAGSRPMELLLISLGGCSGSDVVSILTKKRVSIDQLEINVTGDRENTHPKVFSKIHLEYVFYGNNLPVQYLERAIDLSQNKYCPISAMLRKSCEITHSYRIEEKND